MKTEIIEKESFCVIGKEGSTEQGAGFVQKLWNDANTHFNEVAPLAKKDANGNLAGCWGAMTDFSRGFFPWQNGFTKGLYLAGIEIRDDAEAPEGWTKWEIPGFVFVKIECEDENTFINGLAYLKENKLELAGAVQDFTDVNTGKSYMLFPIKRL